MTRNNRKPLVATRKFAKLNRAIRLTLERVKIGSPVKVFGWGPHNGTIKELYADGKALINLGDRVCRLELDEGGNADPKRWQTDDFSSTDLGQPAGERSRQS